MQCNVASERTYMASLHCFFFCGGLGHQHTKGANGSRYHSIYELTELTRMMSDDVSDEDRPQDRELRPLLFFRIVCEFFNVPQSPSDKM